jgi:hypothetical protein
MFYDFTEFLVGLVLVAMIVTFTVPLFWLLFFGIRTAMLWALVGIIHVAVVLGIVAPPDSHR